MKIAYLTNKYPHVRHTFIRREIVGLVKHGVDVKRYTIRQSDEDLVDPGDRDEKSKTEALLDSGVLGLLMAVVTMFFRQPIRCLGAFWIATRWGMRSDRGLIRHWAYFAEACLLAPRMAREGVGHLHVHFGTNCAVVAYLARLLGGPTYSLTIHGPEEWDRPEMLFLREKYEAAHFVVSVSEFGRCQVFRWCTHSYWNRVHLVRCGVDEVFLGQDPHPLPARDTFVLVGALVEQKGHLRLLEALERLAARGRDFEMILVGDGPLRATLESEIVRHKLTGKVRITGWASNEAVRRYNLEAKLYIMPSFAENLPVGIMEAMALGRPVISTYVAGIPELVEPGVTGWLVPAGAIEPLVEVIEAAMDMPLAELEKMGRAGAARVAQLHNAYREAGSMAALFQQLPGPVTVGPDSPPARSYLAAAPTFSGQWPDKAADTETQKESQT